MLSMQSSAVLKPFGSRLACGQRASNLARPALRNSCVKPAVCQAGHKNSQDGANIEKAKLLGAAGMLSPLLLDVHTAFAQKGELGIIEGRTASLIHPAIMFFLFGATFYTGYLGLQWRTARTIPSKIKELKAELPAADSEGNRPSSPIDQEIADLEKKRKDLVKGNFRDTHFNWGSLLLGLGVLIAVVGPVNTYIRTGKLFPGPHLYAGAGIAVLWAAAAALVPAMQKGNDNARTLHITLNCLNLALFAWQVPTGLEIVWKVFEFTSLP